MRNYQYKFIGNKNSYAILLPKQERERDHDERVSWAIY